MTRFLKQLKAIAIITLFLGKQGGYNYIGNNIITASPLNYV